MKKILFLLMSLIVSSYMLQCNKRNTNPVGSNYYQRANLGSQNHALFYALPTDTFFLTTAHTHQSASLYTGEYRGFTAGAFMQFETWKDSGLVTAPKLKLKISDVYFENEQPLQLALYTVNTRWDESNLTFETFSDAMLDQKIGEVTYIQQEIDSVDTDTLAFELDASLINGWMDSTIQNNGLYLKVETPDALIRLYSSASTASAYRPAIVYNWSEDTTENLHTSAATQDVFWAYKEVLPDPDRLFITNGLALRSYLAFDLTEIPEKATINYASLKLTQDPDLAVPNTDAMSVYAYRVDALNGDAAQAVYDSTQIHSAGTDSLTLNLNLQKFVQSWVADSTANLGVILKGKYETSLIEQRGFFSSTAPDSASLPVLEVYYSQNPESMY